jgi:small GTP-binding protein
MTTEKKEPLYKILLLGDSSVGKTCFFMRYIENTFQEIHMSTIGLESKIKTVDLDDGRTVKIQLWDTAGEERFHTITKNYYKTAHAIILIFDVTEKATYQNVKNWVEQIREEVSSKVVTVLVGNKIDDVENRKINKEEGEEMAKECGISYFECSAKTGENIDPIFNDLIKKTIENYKVLEDATKLDSKKKSKKKRFC